MRKSFTWFLSLMVLLTAFATHGYAQEAQETVELYAEDASYCYDEANDYTVTISVRDFIKLNRFELNLEFNDEIFSFEGATGIHASLSTTTVSESGGIVSIDWSGSATTIGDNVKTDIMVLHFSVLGYPGNIATSFASDMDWGTTNFWYDVPDDDDDLVNTDISTDGSLAVTVELTGIETQITPESCAGGEATITVTAPEADWYLFNEDPNPANWVWTSSPEYLAAAGETVTIRVKNDDGCMSLMQTVIIPESIDPVAFTVTTQDPACYGGNGSVVINATGGTAPYTYYIAPDDAGSPDLDDIDTKTNFQFSMAPGVYWVNVQDANDCAELDWVMIEIVDGNTPIVITATPTDVLCYGEETGEIDVSVDPVAAYQLSIDGGDTWVSTTDGIYTFEDLAAGTYTVHAMNENGCVVSVNSVVIDEPAAPVTFDMEIVDTSCGGDDDGEIAVTNIAGGTAPYTLEIEEGGNVTTETGVDATGFTFTGLMPTYYSLTITDANGCVVEYDNPNGTGNVIAVQSPDDIQYNVVITDPLCNNEAASVAITNVTGGTGSYTYSFDGGATWVDTMTIDSWVYPYAGATIWVANADSTCAVQQMIDSDDVDNPDLLLASVEDWFAPTCIDGNDGSIRLRIEGGVKPYYYSINGSSARETSTTLTNIRVGVGVHTILVWDDNGCEYEFDIIQDVDMDENVIEAFSDLHIDCFGDKVGTISVDFLSWADGLAMDGQPNRGIQWYVQNEAGQVSSFMPSNGGGTTTTFNAGTYIVWVVDQYTCESNPDTVVITQNPELLIDVVYTTAASCFNTFEGVITVHATGGFASEMNKLEYAVVNNEAALGNIDDGLWLPFDTYNDEDYDPALSTVSFQVDGGTYWIAVRDDGCDEKWYGPIEVEGYEELLVDEDDIVATDPLCFESSDGTISVPMSAVTGGAGAYKFTLLEWVEGEWVAVEVYTEVATGEFTGLPAGTYAVLVEDSEDCPSYTTEEIVLVDPAELTYTTQYWHFSCEDSNDGIITLNVSGGTGNYWYAINNQNAWVAFGNEVSTKTYIATEPGTFVVWVKDENGCIAESDTITILEPEALDAEVTVDNHVSCYGDSDGQITVEGSGGWGVSMFEFKINDGTWSSATTFSGLPAGDHILHIRDVNAYSEPYQALDCEYSVPFTIEQPDPITYDVVIEDVSCKDGEDGTFTVSILSGGTPFVDEDGDDDGFLVRLTGSGYDSGWDYTGVDNAYTFTGLAHSHYTIYILDANGCDLPASIGNAEGPYTTQESWEVQEPDTYLTLEAEWVQDATCYDAEDGQFLLHADGGTAPYKYWAGLSVEPDGHVLVPEAPAEDSDEWQESNEFNVGAGTWVVWVLDANGCIVGGEYENGIPVNKWRVKIEQPDELLWDFHMVGDPAVVHYVQPSCFGAWDGAIHLVNISGGSGTYNARVWGLSAANQPVDTTYTDIEIEGSLYWLRGVPASNEDGFAVTVTDDNDCTSVVDTIFVDQPEELAVELIKSEGSFTCSDAVEGWIEAVATGGSGNYEYQLLKNGEIHTAWQSIASAFLVQIGNEFTVQVRDADADDCETEATIDIQQIADVVIVDIENRSCFGMVYPKAVVTATAEPGRALWIRYQKVRGEGLVDPWEDWVPFNEEEGEGTHVFTDELTFGDDNESDGHYNFQVMDEEGCLSEVEFKTFVPIQNAVVMNYIITGVEECSAVVEITNITGGVEPYVVMLDDSVMTEWTFTLPRGEFTIKAMDAHMCTVEEVVEIVGEYVTREIEIETFIGYTTEFVDEEAGVDTMLAVGTYEYVYMFGECERTLIVTVVEVPRPLAIAEVQGEGDASPWLDDIVKVTGTVTGISAGEGFFMQDANAAWGGIWVAYGDVAGLEIGDGVEVVGSVAEVASVTTINATEVEMVDAPLAVEAVVVDTPSDAENEMYESVLVQVEGARAMAADPGNGEWTIFYTDIDNVVVNDWLFAFTPVEGNFYHVTGIVNARLDMFKLEPRMESDIVDLTATPADLIPTVEFKVYPNPFNDRIYLDNNDKLTRVVISNIAGQRVMDIEYPNREIRTANLVSGVYVVSMFTENGLAKTERIVKR
jgi:hypothetical protein